MVYIATGHPGGTDKMCPKSAVHINSGKFSKSHATATCSEYPTAASFWRAMNREKFFFACSIYKLLLSTYYGSAVNVGYEGTMSDRVWPFLCSHVKYCYVTVRNHQTFSENSRHKILSATPHWKALQHLQEPNGLKTIDMKWGLHDKIACKNKGLSDAFFIPTYTLKQLSIFHDVNAWHFDGISSA